MLRVEAGGQEVAAGRREQQARDDGDAGVERVEHEQGDGGVRDADDRQDQEVERPEERQVRGILARHVRSQQSVGLASRRTARPPGPFQTDS